jgi:hypothetical protein
MKYISKSPLEPAAPKRAQIKFPAISEEMKQWSAMLQAELSTWPDIAPKPAFGFLFFYRGKKVFAGLPRTRGFDSPSCLIFKFDPMPKFLQRRAQSDPRLDASMKESSKGWFSFELSSEEDLRDALFWLNHAYECAEPHGRARAARASSS